MKTQFKISKDVMNKHKESQIIYDALIDIMPKDVINIIIEFRTFNNLHEFYDDIALFYDKFEQEIFNRADGIIESFLNNAQLPTDKDELTVKSTINYIERILKSLYGRNYVRIFPDLNDYYYINIYQNRKTDVLYGLCWKVIEYIRKLKLRCVKSIYHSSNNINMLEYKIEIKR